MRAVLKCCPAPCTPPHAIMHAVVRHRELLLPFAVGDSGNNIVGHSGNINRGKPLGEVEYCIT